MGDLVPKAPSLSVRRSLEVVHTYLRKGEGFTRSVWVKVSPRNLVLKVLALPLFLTFVMIFLLMLLIFGFILMALALFWALAKRQRLEGD